MYVFLMNLIIIYCVVFYKVYGCYGKFFLYFRILSVVVKEFYLLWEIKLFLCSRKGGILDIIGMCYN